MNSSSGSFDDAVLAAYLDGDLDEADAERLEAAMAADPSIAARLETVLEVVTALRGLDDVEPPAGYTDRLAARLDAERAPGAASLAAARDRRRRRWEPLAAAAALVVLAGFATTFVTRGGIGGGGDSALTAASTEAAAGSPDAAYSRSTAGMTEQAAPAPDGAVAAEEAFEDADVLMETTAGGAGGPLVLDEAVDLPDEDAVRSRYQDSGVAAGLLGIPLDEASDLEAANRLELERAGPFASGALPAACLDVVTANQSGPLVPVQVESAAFAADDALVYVLVGATAGGTELDRVEVWVTAVDGCTTRLFLQL